MNIFLISGLSDLRYGSQTSTTRVWKPLIFATSRIMRTDTHQMGFAQCTRQSFIISKCPPATYLALFRCSLSPYDFMARTYLAVIRFEPSGSSPLRTARKVPQLSRSRISAYLHSIILGQFALSSFRLMISVNRHRGCPVFRVSDCLVSLRYPREITCI